jgi:hypothetical protein
MNSGRWVSVRLARKICADRNVYTVAAGTTLVFMFLLLCKIEPGMGPLALFLLAAARVRWFFKIAVDRIILKLYNGWCPAKQGTTSLTSAPNQSL